MFSALTWSQLPSFAPVRIMVSGAAVTIVIGKLADMYGAKMLLLVFICYTVGTALAGFAQEIYTLLALRVLQGIAVALVPICVRIARDLYPKEKFPMAQGVILPCTKQVVRWD